jgi:hypothetical protein
MHTAEVYTAALGKSPNPRNERASLPHAQARAYTQDAPFASTSESFDGEELALLHFGCIPPFYDGHRFAGMDLVRPNAVSIQIPDALDGIHFTIQLNFVAFHDLLDSCTNIAQPHIDACSRNARIGGCFHRVDERVVPRVEMDGARAINDAPAYVCPEIQLHHVVVLQHRLVTSIGSVVRSHPVEGAAGGECDARLEWH